MTAILIALVCALLNALIVMGIMSVFHRWNWYIVTIVFAVTFCIYLGALALCKAASRQNPE